MYGVIEPVDTVITDAAVDPVSVDYARRHIKSLGHEDDLLIASWIKAATQYVEKMTSRQIITTTRELRLDAFPVYSEGVPTGDGFGTRQRIELPKPPLQSVVSVQYLDGDGTLQSFSDGGSPDVPYYRVEAYSGPYAPRGYVEPLYGLSWPTARYEGGSVRIQYKAGYGDTESTVPPLLAGVICYLVGHFDQVRTAVPLVQRGAMVELPYGVQMMLSEFMVLRPQTLRGGLVVG